MRRDPNTPRTWRPLLWSARLLVASAVGVGFGFVLRQVTQKAPTVDLSSNPPQPAPAPPAPPAERDAPRSDNALVAGVTGSAAAVCEGAGGTAPDAPWGFPAELPTAVAEEVSTTGRTAAVATATAERAVGTTVAEGATRAAAEIEESRARAVRPKPVGTEVTVAPPPHAARAAGPAFPPLPDPLKGTGQRKDP